MYLPLRPIVSVILHYLQETGSTSEALPSKIKHIWEILEKHYGILAFET